MGNFPGVTVDKKTGGTQLAPGLQARITDLPGTYSLYPKSADERVATEVLLNPTGPDRPDLILVIADAAALKRNLLFCTQIIDLKRPTVVALTMMDVARQRGIRIDVPELERQLGVPVVPINPRRGRGIPQLRKVLADVATSTAPMQLAEFVSTENLAGPWIGELRELTGLSSPYAALHAACQWSELPFLTAAQRIGIPAMLDSAGFNKTKTQAEEVMQRYARIGRVMEAAVVEETPQQRAMRSERIDRVLLHPLWGNVLLLLTLFLLFQSIFWLAEYPMTWVEEGFAAVSGWLGDVLPGGWVKDLFINGLLAGISGVAVFVPQIALLFAFITILEDTGYMARISFLTDRLMRSVGLGGRSVMPLVSGMACAVPAVMAARTITAPKERLLTILVTPLMSCSARLPVYTVLIALVVPDIRLLGIFNLKGLVLMALYLLGFFGALIVARVLNFFVKAGQRTSFLMELPVYRAPRWKTVATNMWEKSRVFVRDAGKIILVVSMLLWALASYGPADIGLAGYDNKPVSTTAQSPLLPHPSTAMQELAAKEQRLEASFAGHFGKWIEPVIRPLGYDWKIGIALITSFAAREVFVGTMATLYSVGEDADETTLRDKMRAATFADGRPAYTLATGLSLLIFYVFALQCSSTLAVVKRETGSWKYPLFQFVYMGAMAYLSALLVYQVLK